MALIEQLEKYFPHGHLSGAKAAAHEGAFLLDAEALLEYCGEPVKARDRLQAISPGVRIFELLDSPAQWREVESGATDLFLDSPIVGVLVAYPGKVTTVLAESLGTELYGSERGHIELVNGLVKRGVLFHTLVLAGKHPFRDALVEAGSGLIDVPRHLFPTRNVSADYWAPGEVLLDLFRPLNSAKPDLLFAHSVIARITPLGSKAIDRPLVWWFHEYGDRDHGFRFIPSRSDFSGAASEVSSLKIANSHSVAKHLFPIREHCEIVDYVTEEPVQVSASQSHRDTIRIGMAGRMEPQKGQEVAIKALGGLVDEGLDIELHFFGTGIAQNVARLKLRISQLHLSERVFFHGFVKDIEVIYSQLDALVVASTSEAYGRVPQEAGVRGIPVFFREGGYPGQKLMERFGEIEFSFSDHRELKKGLKTLVVDRSSRNSMKSAIKEFWAERLSPERYFDDWNEKLRAVANRSGVA
jgi:glycosyltransferase involved in cell wall biosynthesis